MDVSAALFGAFVGLPFGVVASALAWWAVFHGFRPRLEWTNSVEEVPAAGRVTDYAVAFHNLGRRSAVEVHTHARLRIRGLIPGRPKRWLVIEIPTNSVAVAKGRQVGRPVSVTPAQLAYATQLRDAGETIAEIVVKTGVTRSSLYRHLPPRPREGLTAGGPPPTDRHEDLTGTQIGVGGLVGVRQVAGG